MKDSIIINDKKYNVEVNVNGLIVNKNAFYDIFNNNVSLETVFLSKDGNREHLDNSPTFKKYRILEPYLTAKYGEMYCAKHCRLLENSKCDICTQ